MDTSFSLNKIRPAAENGLPVQDLPLLYFAPVIRLNLLCATALHGFFGNRTGCGACCSAPGVRDAIENCLDKEKEDHTFIVATKRLVVKAMGRT